MERYTIYCTEEQTKKALELGAPIKEQTFISAFGKLTVGLTTAEQMIGWLEEQGLICDVFPVEHDTNTQMFAYRIGIIWNKYESNAQDYKHRKDATLAAIDSALDYLIKNKN